MEIQEACIYRSTNSSSSFWIFRLLELKIGERRSFFLVFEDSRSHLSLTKKTQKNGNHFNIRKDQYGRGRHTTRACQAVWAEVKRHEQVFPSLLDRPQAVINLAKRILSSNKKNSPPRRMGGRKRAATAERKSTKNAHKFPLHQPWATCMLSFLVSALGSYCSNTLVWGPPPFSSCRYTVAGPRHGKGRGMRKEPPSLSEAGWRWGTRKRERKRERERERGPT